MAREEGARAVIKGIEGRIEDWKAGSFPTPNITHLSVQRASLTALSH